MITFKDFLTELDASSNDVEDMSPDELRTQAKNMMRQAQMKKGGQDQLVNRRNLADLRQRLRTATSPQEKADIQRRIKELTMAQRNPNAVI